VAIIVTRRAAMVAHLFDILVDGRAVQIHRGSHRRRDGRCSKDHGERPDTALFEDIHVQPSVLDDEGKRLKYRFVPAFL